MDFPHWCCKRGRWAVASPPAHPPPRSSLVIACLLRSSNCLKPRGFPLSFSPFPRLGQFAVMSSQSGCAVYDGTYTWGDVTLPEFYIKLQSLLLNLNGNSKPLRFLSIQEGQTSEPAHTFVCDAAIWGVPNVSQLKLTCSPMSVKATPKLVIRVACFASSNKPSCTIWVATQTAQSLRWPWGKPFVFLLTRAQRCRRTRQSPCRLRR